MPIIKLAWWNKKFEEGSVSGHCFGHLVFIYPSLSNCIPSAPLGYQLSRRFIHVIWAALTPIPSSGILWQSAFLLFCRLSDFFSLWETHNPINYHRKLSLLLYWAQSEAGRAELSFYNRVARLRVKPTWGFHAQSEHVGARYILMPWLSHQKASLCPLSFSDYASHYAFFFLLKLELDFVFENQNSLNIRPKIWNSLLDGCYLFI